MNFRSYIHEKREKRRKQKEEAEDEEEKETEDAQMFKSIRSMMLESGGLSSSNTTSTEEDTEDGLDQHAEAPDDADYDDELPSNLIVTGLPGELFSSVELKHEFEQMFARFDASCHFGYFRLLKRCCVQFDEPMVAVLARLELDRVLFMNTQLKMYLNKVFLKVFLYFVKRNFHLFSHIHVPEYDFFMILFVDFFFQWYETFLI